MKPPLIRRLSFFSFFLLKMIWCGAERQHHFKSETMLNFIVKTHRKNVIYSGNQIYILNKGLNSGKPQKEPFTNSFVIIFQNEEDAETVYWLAYSLWKAKFWHQSLCGSVIPFLRLPEFKKNFNPKVSEMFFDFELHQKQINTLRILEQKEQHFQKNLTLINELRRVILHNYYKL